MSHDEVASNRSALKEFLASIATISGDLSNITAPPFVLLENSTVEIPQYQADHTELFLAPATEDDALQRALLVLKNFLSSLRNQQYAGRKEDQGVKKPLNAFLGELFLGRWPDEQLGETRLLSEQVSHHPPVTACYIWNDKLGVSAEGFTQQEITFSGNVHIKQKGYAVLHLDRYKEEFLIPVPNVKVKGILTGPYPELHGEYNLVSSSGYVSHIKFEGKSLLGTGQKNGFEARLYHVDKPDEGIYTVEGAWNGSWTIVDARSGQTVETFDLNTLQQRKLEVSSLSEQDAWESRKAWADVIAALKKGDMKNTTQAKSVVEEGQRQMRKDEEARGEHWKPLFYRRVDHDPIFDKLAVHDNGSYTVEREGGIWKIDREAVNNAQKPYHGGLTPSNRKISETLANGSRKTSAVESGGLGQSTPAATVPGADTTGDPNTNTMQSNTDALSDRDGHAPEETMRAMGIAEDPSNKSQANATPRQLHASKTVDLDREPTDAEVEAFLRARTSNAR